MRTLCSAIGIATLCLAGCASQTPLESRPPLPQLGAGQSGLVEIRIESKPMGATVVRNGMKLGRTPVSIRVPVEGYSREGRAMLACASSEPVTLTWESGASTTVSGLCSQYPTVTATRPADAPGLDQDLRVEAKDRANREHAATIARAASNGHYEPYGPPIRVLISDTGGSYVGAPPSYWISPPLY
jgi:hypothetical protein